MKTRKMLAIILIIFMMVSCATIVSASSFKFAATAQKEIFKPGEEVVVSLDIDEIDAGAEGINVVEMSLEYDKNVFDNMEFVKENDWDFTYNAVEDSEKFGKLLYTNISTGVTEAEDIGKIKFKLKDNLPDMETEIKLLSVTSNDGKVLIPEGDRIIKIKIVSDKTETEEPEKTEEPQEPEQPADPEPEKPTQEEPTKPEEKQEEKITFIPQTGQTRIIYVVVGIIIACALIALAIGVILSGKSETAQTKKEDNKEENNDNNDNNE